MEVVQYFRTVAEFADYSCSLLFDELKQILSVVSSGSAPPWFLSCCSLSLAFALMCKIWR